MSAEQSHISVSDASRAPKSVFFAATMVMFVLTFSAADSIGFVPYYIDGSTQRTEDSFAPKEVALSDLPMLGEETTQVETALPVRISISAIGLDLAVQNPSTTDIEALDELLKDGPARYALSAELGEMGNVIIFAHSSHLPIVHNQMYKAFNRVPELKSGDTITLTGEDGISYIYTVESVEKANAEEAKIDLSKDTKQLTLVTCDTLTGKSARYVVTASFVGTVN